jgi:hypothetical protein
MEIDQLIGNICGGLLSLPNRVQYTSSVLEELHCSKPK